MLVAAAKSVWDLVDQSQWAGIGLVVALLGLAWVMYRLRAWFGEDTDHSDAPGELLTHLRQLKLEGQVSEEEFRNIKGRLIERMEQSLATPQTGSGERPATSQPTAPRDGFTPSSGD